MINNATIKCIMEVHDLTRNLKATFPLADQIGLGQVVFNNASSAYSSSSMSPGFYVYTLKVNGTAKDSKMMLIER